MARVKMSKLDAAEMVARAAVSFAVDHDQGVTLLLVQESASQMLHDWAPGTYGHTAAETYNYRTAHRLACQILRNLGRLDLIKRPARPHTPEEVSGRGPPPRGDPDGRCERHNPTGVD